MTLDDKIVVPESVIYQKVGGELVFLNMDTGKYYGLDPVGTRIWELLYEKKPLRAVMEQILSEYTVAPSQLEADVLRIVGELQAKGLVKVVS